MNICEGCKHIDLCKYAEQTSEDANCALDALSSIQTQVGEHISVSFDVKCVHGRRLTPANRCSECCHFSATPHKDNRKYDRRYQCMSVDGWYVKGAFSACENFKKRSSEE